MNRLPALAAAFATSVALHAGAATAATATITVDGHDWLVTTIEGAYADPDVANTLRDQVWWDNITLAREFAEALAGLFSVDQAFTPLDLGPLFAYRLVELSDPLFLPVVESFGYVFGDPSGVASFAPETRKTATFATAEKISPVPLPAAGWLLIGGVGAIGAVARRKRAN